MFNPVHKTIGGIFITQELYHFYLEMILKAGYSLTQRREGHKGLQAPGLVFLGVFCAFARDQKSLILKSNGY